MFLIKGHLKKCYHKLNTQRTGCKRLSDDRSSRAMQVCIPYKRIYLTLKLKILCGDSCKLDLKCN